MHTFSPAKMWIAGLSELRKPLLHLHTQFNRDIPWDSIDMDFMNLNQAAHGDREYGFIGARMGMARKVVVGYWEDPECGSDIGRWARVAVGVAEGRNLKVARFGDNMREVAVTEGDKVEAQIQFGWSVNGYGVGDLVSACQRLLRRRSGRADGRVRETCTILPRMSAAAGPARDRVREQARIELGLRAFLTEGGFGAFTTTFEDLHGLPQLPGLAVQRLMGDGFGFAGEGDWKTAALVRVMKIDGGRPARRNVLHGGLYLPPGAGQRTGAGRAHAGDLPLHRRHAPRIEVHPLGIGGKADPARLVFDGASGPAINASVVDLGSRFRLIINQVDAVKPQKPMPNLPVARVLWKPQPSLRVAAETWILAGGAHHTGFSLALTAEQMIDWAELVGIESLLIDKDTARSPSATNFAGAMPPGVSLRVIP